MRLMETPKRPGFISRMRAKLWALPRLCSSHSPTSQALPPDASSQTTQLMIPTSALQRENNAQASDAGLSNEEDAASHVKACFPSSTVFQREDDTKVSAAELRGNGGDVLVGPDGTRVRSSLAVTHSGQKRDMVRVRTESGMLLVTDDHRLIIEDAQGEKVYMVAHDILPGQGQGHQRVTSVDHFSEIMDFVQVTFENDASVLAWSPEKRPSRSLNLPGTFVVRGAPHTVDRYYIGEKDTFLGNPKLPKHSY